MYFLEDTDFKSPSGIKRRKTTKVITEACFIKDYFICTVTAAVSDPRVYTAGSYLPLNWIVLHYNYKPQNVANLWLC